MYRAALTVADRGSPGAGKRAPQSCLDFDSVERDVDEENNNDLATI